MSASGVMRVALIGCGAIAESFHLPALAPRHGRSVSVVLVDPSRERRERLATRFKIPDTAPSHEDVIGDVEAAIVATPHHLHMPIGRSLLERGIAVLSEKPLATSVSEIEQLNRAAKQGGAVLAVNQTRRFIPACQEIRGRLEVGELGTIRRVQMDEGDRFGWPSASPAMFGARSGGKGVLLDIGVHALDLAHWWLGGEFELTSYQDDSFGGSEAATCAVFERAETQVELNLRWLAKRANEYTIEGERGTISWSVYDLDRITVSSKEDGAPRVIRIPGAPTSFDGLADRVLDDFISAVRTGNAPSVGPLDVLPPMRLIEACYAHRETFTMPWHSFDLPLKARTP